ncbi:DUF4843 domain-containing protein [Chitinophaga pinensis]|uniref:DUF4843 domain-containing protein n=1 Tax=Chitinophaga pinensis TaxID=79329 RepID=UPI003965715C
MADANLKDSILQIRVDLMGRQADHDRSFGVKVIDSLSSAVAGVHYEALADSYIMPANKSWMYIPYRSIARKKCRNVSICCISAYYPIRISIRR